MKPSTILVIEDNPITRKVIRVTLEGAGHQVLEAEDAHTGLEWMTRSSPDLVLQDVVLPDMDGFELLARLRAMPRGADIPILAFSGFLSTAEQARGQGAGFTDYLFKPVEPSRILQTVRAYLAPLGPLQGKPGDGMRILVAHDDAAQRKLLRVRLERLGFRVTTAEDGVEALEQAKQSPPHAILSDTLMPRMDGFRLALAIRLCPELAHIPVVLISAAFTEKADRNLAETVGASALLTCTPDHREAIDTLLASLGKPAPLLENPVKLSEEYTHRIIRQLEHQVLSNAGLAQRLAWRDAELSILAGLTECLEANTSVQSILEELLYRSLDAAGVAKGAVYFVQEQGILVVRAQLGYSKVDKRTLEDFFGHAGLLLRALQQGECLALPSPEVSEEWSRDLLGKSGAKSLVIAPLVFGADRQGVLVMASVNRDLGEDWLPFAKALGAEIGLAVRLTRTLSQLQENEETLARIVDTTIDGLVISDQDGRVTFANAAAERIFGAPAGEMVGRVYHDPAWRITALDGKPCPQEAYAVARVMKAGRSVFDVQAALVRPDGRQAIISVNAALLRAAEGRMTGVVESVRDITNRKRAETELAEQAERLAGHNAELEQFAAVAAHDLQEPLRTVAGFAQLLALRYRGRLDAQADKYIEQAVAGCVRMRELIQDLSVYCGISRRADESTPIPSEAAFQRSMENLQAAIAEAGAVVTHTPLPLVTADPAKLERLFQNLISNALKFRGREPSQVHVSAQPGTAEWIFAVRDNGIGIDPQHTERIFKMFERLHSREKYPGTGAGLAICKRIVEQHRGRIWVESQPGQGATFYFALPAKEVVPA